MRQRRRFMKRRTSTNTIKKRNNATLSLRIQGAFTKDRNWCMRLIYGPIPLMILTLTGAEFLSWLAFSPFYMYISSRCHLENSTFLSSFFLSMITQTTIGYSAPELTFDHCPWVGFFFIIIVGCQAVVGLILNGILISTLYTKILRYRRAPIDIIFSDKATLQKINGDYFFCFQTFGSCEQLLEAQVRCYAIKHFNKPDDAINSRGIFFQQYTLRLFHPADDLGQARLLLALPTIVMHRIDTTSPLYPSSIEETPSSPYYFYHDIHDKRLMLSGNSGQKSHPERPQKTNVQHSSFLQDTIQDTTKFSEIQNSSRSMNQYLNRILHKTEKQEVDNEDEQDNLLENGTSSSQRTTHFPSGQDFQRFREYFQTSDLEILVVIQAIDPFTTSTVMARHSYNFHSGDILFDHSYVSCVDLAPDGAAVIDINAINKTVSASSSEESCQRSNNNNKNEESS